MKPNLPDLEVIALAKSLRGPYLAALGGQATRRAGLLAVWAFEAELARIPATVNEPMMGRIRLQWWLDVLPGVAGGRAPSHPVARALEPLNLQLDHLRALAECHNFDLDEASADVAEHDAHAQGKARALADLLFGVLGVDDGDARAAGAAVLAAWVLSEAATGPRVADGDDAQALRDLARGHLARARGIPVQGAAKRGALGVLLLAKLVERRLADAEDDLGAGAVLGVWWGSIAGLY